MIKKIPNKSFFIGRQFRDLLSKMLISAICQKVRPPITSPRVSCPHCDQTFSKKSNLNAHLKRKHLETIQRNIKLYQCDKCPKQFTRLVQSY